MKPRVSWALMTFSASVMALGLAACTVTRNWQYPPDPPGSLLNVKGSKTLPVTVAVLPLRDLRGATVERESWRLALPLVPYAVNSFDRPETVQDPEGVLLIHMNPSRDFAMAIANELRHAGIFSTVAFTESLTTKPDLVLSGTIRSTNWRRSYTTYGLGPMGPLVWILGAPMGKATNTVAMDLQLAPQNEPSRAMWQFTMEFQDSHLFGIYYGMEESVENYANAVQETLKPAISNLVKIATERPELFRPGFSPGVSAAQSQ
jgi:hypothetical protein